MNRTLSSLFDDARTVALILEDTSLAPKIVADLMGVAAHTWHVGSQYNLGVVLQGKDHRYFTYDWTANTSQEGYELRRQDMMDHLRLRPWETMGDDVRCLYLLKGEFSAGGPYYCNPRAALFMPEVTWLVRKAALSSPTTDIEGSVFTNIRTSIRNYSGEMPSYLYEHGLLTEVSNKF